jgi:hypothetical protein
MHKIIPDIFANPSPTNTRSRFAEYTNRSQNRFNTETNQITESYSDIVTSFSIYKLITELTKNFKQLPAYKAGLIDENGKFLKREKYLNEKEKQILSPFARLVIGMKRLIGNLASSKLKAEFGYMQTAARALAFECKQVGGDDTLFLEEIQKVIDVLVEEGEIGNAVGNEAIANLDLKTGGPIIRPERKNKSGILMRVRRSLKDM